jgi:AraC family transcriptional regulator
VAGNLGKNCGPVSRVLARGEGWSVRDVVCCAGPRDKPFEEQHHDVSIAIVLGGTFQYRSSGGGGRHMMTPGSLLLGNAGDCFECGHEHGVGDRCVAFAFSREYFEGIAGGGKFRVPRVPALHGLSPVVARASAAVEGQEICWEEFGIALAGDAIRMSNGADRDAVDLLPSTVARITRAVRMIEENCGEDLTIARLAREARLSPYHFLRTFEGVTGVTPHQYARRMRLRDAATRLATSDEKVLDIAFDCGFGDVSNFNRAFRAEFGVSPRRYRF